LRFELPALKQTALVVVVRDPALLPDLPVGSIKTTPEPRWVGRVLWKAGQAHPVEVTYRNTAGRPRRGTVDLITLDRRLGRWPTRQTSGNTPWELGPGQTATWRFDVTPPADFRGGLVYASIKHDGGGESHFSFLVEQPAQPAPTTTSAAAPSPKRKVYALMKCLTIPDIDGVTTVDWSGQKGDVASRINFLLDPKAPDAPKTWRGPKDFSGSVRLLWGKEGLYLTADMTDDVVMNHAHGDVLWSGDSIHLVLDTARGPEDPSRPWSGDCYQIMLSPTSSSGRPAMYLKAVTQNGEPGASAIACKRTAGGYCLEAFVAAANFRTWKPVVGKKILLALTIIDHDPGRSQSWAWACGNLWTDRHGMHVAHFVRYAGWHE